MKPTVIFPILTAILGFGAGWLLKPAPVAPQEARKTQSARTAPPQPSEVISEEAPAVTGSPSHLTPKTEIRRPEKGTITLKSLDEARLARLTEALNLSDEQRDEIVVIAQRLGANTPGGGSDPRASFEKAILSSDEAAAALGELLTPEQAKEFAALRKRATDNAIENQVQNRLSSISQLTDLSPEQREKLTEKIRETTAATYLARPDNFDLLLDISPLPMGSGFVANASVDRLMADASSGGDADQIELSFRETQRQNLDAQLDLYKDILTPAQQARMKLDIDERKAALDRLGELLR